MTAAESLRQGGISKQAMAHAICGLVHRGEDDWHEALRLSTEYGLRLIAVDALEALGEAAAAADSAAEAIRLLAAADRLRHETGYQWRYHAEQTTYDAAMLAARQDLADDGDSAWREGLTLDLPHALDYADGHTVNTVGPATDGPASPRPNGHRSQNSSPAASPTLRSPNSS